MAVTEKLWIRRSSLQRTISLEIVHTSKISPIAIRKNQMTALKRETWYFDLYVRYVNSPPTIRIDTVLSSLIQFIPTSIRKWLPTPVSMQLSMTYRLCCRAYITVINQWRFPIFRNVPDIWVLFEKVSVSWYIIWSDLNSSYSGWELIPVSNGKDNPGEIL